MKLRVILSFLMCYYANTVGYPMGEGADYEIAVVPKHERRSETEHKIPIVPRESRAQYYIKNDDGTFTYGYDTGSGIYEMAKKTGVNDVKGIYGFSYPDGRTTKVSYIAGGERGFVPKIEENSDGILKRTTSNLGASFPRQNFGLKSDSSYSFSYENEGSARSETADADLNIIGSYSFVADDGIRRTVNYKAGSDTGFVVDADFIPAEEKITALRHPSTYSSQRDLKYVSSGENQEDSKNLKPDGSYSFQYRNADSSRKETADADLNVKGEYSFIADDGIRRTVNYKAGSDTGFVVDADFIPTEEKVSALRRPSTYSSQRDLKYVSRGENQGDSTDSKPDGSYSFQYRNANSSRKETADADLNVEGEYSFIADDGIRRTVNYKAGSDTGFVAYADFIPTEEKIPTLKRPSTYSSQRDLKYISRGESQGDSKDLKPDGSYSFQYRNDDNSRKETADATSTRRISSHKHAATINPVPKYVPLNDELKNSDDSKLDERDRSYHITKDRSRKEVVSADFNSLNTYSFIDSQGVKEINSEPDYIFSPRTASPLRSARDYQTFMTHTNKEENFHSDILSRGQTINPSNRNSEPSSSSTKYLVGNVLLKKYSTGPERGYVFTAA